MNDVAPMRRLLSTSNPISPAKFAHFVLRTGQLDPMAEWYQTLLNARIVVIGFSWSGWSRSHRRVDRGNSIPNNTQRLKSLRHTIGRFPR